MGSKRYSNKGVNSARLQQNKTGDKSTLITVIAAIALVAVIIAAVVIAVAMSNNGGDQGTTNEEDTYRADVNMTEIGEKINSMEIADYKEVTLEENLEIADIEHNYVQIRVKDYGDIIVRLRDDVAPGTVSNFKWLVYEKFYDGLTFHRVIQNFMIQGGCPEGTGNGNSGQWIQGEFSANGINNELSHVRGVISMARADDMDSASSQFFICDADSTHLDGQYAAFGYVVAGMDVVDAIAATEVDANSKPVTDVVIESIRFVEPNE